ncbi:Uncharacterised protein [BD1-7 clade bacterium]|uniref:Molybdenum carrier n=1 Tax=BD1-7 clade bacterium TaxID=2029982 RepID=A0A5S9QH94_9GAMM|nr:Uncharacterised protein [BD1-7 clade bacterium]CAA0116976.1 Uncharacterised protein [BD1-7 clade bacterium]
MDDHGLTRDEIIVPMTWVTGGQTGADRACMDVALEYGVRLQGFCPRQRMAEDGPIDDQYPLQAIDGDYDDRTRANVVLADATVIFYATDIRGGSALTRFICDETKKPYLLLEIHQLSISDAVAALADFVEVHAVKRLNIAGPRASECAGIYAYVRSALSAFYLHAIKS